MLTASLEDQLADIDWSFQNNRNEHPVEAIHPYPAKFISDLPRTLLRILPLPANTGLLDPFCGSGVSLVEAQRAGLAAVGIDLNPIACLMTRVKTNPAPNAFLRTATEIAARAKLNWEPDAWDIPNIDHWFKDDVQIAVAATLQEIRTMADADLALGDALRLALSAILVRVSNQDSDTRYAAIEKSVTGGEVFDLFLSSCGRIARALSARDWSLTPTKIVERDTLATTPCEIGTRVGIVITSPPYPNAYEYWLYHKYRMWWLGYDPLAVKEKEIGARAHFFKKDPHTADHFRVQMDSTLAVIDSVLVESGFVCFVVGRSKIHGAIVDNAGIVMHAAENRGLRLVARMERVISPTRKAFNLSHANIKTETIIVLQKG